MRLDIIRHKRATHDISAKDVVKLTGLDRRYLLVLRSGSGDFKGLPELKTGIKAKVIETE